MKTTPRPPLSKITGLFFLKVYVRPFMIRSVPFTLLTLS